MYLKVNLWQLTDGDGRAEKSDGGVTNFAVMKEGNPMVLTDAGGDLNATLILASWDAAASSGSTSTVPMKLKDAVY